MLEKELRKKVIGKNGLSNLLLALKIVFDLIPQILLVYLISSLITNNINEGNLKYIFLGIFISFVLKGVFYYFATKVAHEKAYEKLTELILFFVLLYCIELGLGKFCEASIVFAIYMLIYFASRMTLWNMVGKKDICFT